MVQKGVTANTTSSVSDQGEAETRPRTTGKRILVVEDNRGSADSLRLLLEFFEYGVAVAHAGRERQHRTNPTLSCALLSNWGSTAKK
jgi:hypothetical protein